MDDPYGGCSEGTGLLKDGGADMGSRNVDKGRVKTFINNLQKNCCEENAITPYAREFCTVDTFKNKLPITKWLPKYRLNHFIGDLIAGITVTMTVIPQGMAYAAIADLPPQYGLYASFMGGFIYTLFGTSKDISVGPVAIMSLMVAEFGTDRSPVPHDPTYALILSCISGCITLAMGLLNVGFVVQFISHAVVSGFTSAAAIIIGFGQVKSWLGLKNIPKDFAPQVYSIFSNLKETNLWDFCMGLTCLVLLFSLKKCKELVDRRLALQVSSCKTVFYKILWFILTARNAVVVIICASIAAVMVGSYGYKPGDQNFFTLTGKVAEGVPFPAVPKFTIEYFNKTSNTTMTRTTSQIFSDIGQGFVIVSLVGIVESIAIARAFSAKNDYQIDASQELLALGLANVCSSFFHSYPVTGSFSRTAINSQSGVRTPAGSIWTGILVLIAIQCLTPYFYYIPASSLAAIIIAAVFQLIDYEILLPMWRTKKLDLLPLLATFLVCLFTTIEYGIMAGVGLSLAIMLYPMARPELSIRFVMDPAINCEDQSIDSVHSIKEACIILPSQGLKYPCIDYIKDRILKETSGRGQMAAVILNLSHCTGTDYSTVLALKELTEYYHKHSCVFVIACATREVEAILESSRIKNFHLTQSEEEAVSFAIGHSECIGP